MKTIRKISKNPATIILLLVAFLNMSCSQEGVVQGNNELAQKSGKEIFKSIIFMDGELTSQFPVLTNSVDLESQFSDEKSVNEHRELQSRALEYIDKNHPDFFENFKNNMYSQDPLKIRKELLNGVKILVPFLNSELKSKGLDFDVSVRSQEDVKNLKNEILKYKDENSSLAKSEDEIVCGVLAVALAVVAVVVFYVVAISEFWVGAQLNAEDGDQMFVDELSRSIAVELQ